jgi:hypothetical protein
MSANVQREQCHVETAKKRLSKQNLVMCSGAVLDAALGTIVLGAVLGEALGSELGLVLTRICGRR